MKRPLLAGLGACVVFLGLIGILLGYLAINQPDEPTAEPTQTTASVPETLPPETTLPQQTEVPVPDPEFTLTASHAFVYDCNSDTMLYTKGDVAQRIAPASLTKLFTAYVALQYLDADTVLTAGEEVGWIDPESSRAFIYEGQQITAEMCVEGMILQSGNDAAYILAVAAGRAIQSDPGLSAQAALSVFVGEMNTQVLVNGLTNTHFANPDGIDAPGHYTTMQDLITIGRLAMENETTRKYSSLAKDDVTYVSGETCSWKNTNLLLHPESDYYCEAARGLKTGSTDDAGKCLLSAFETEGGYLLVGVLGCPGDLDRYADTLRLYSHYTGIPVEIPEQTEPTTNTAVS